MWLFVCFFTRPLWQPARTLSESGFHENAVEHIFLALKERCEPTKLQVTGRFMRRGGIDINPTRAFGYTSYATTNSDVSR